MPSRFFLALVTAFACLSWSAVNAPAQNLAPTGSDLIFPHLANGDQGNGVWKTNFVFLNNSNDTAQGTLDLSGDNGQSLTLATSRGTGSTFDITVPAHGKYEIETTGAGSVVGGWAEALFDHAVVGSAVFSFSTGLGKVVTVGVLSSLPKTAFVAPAEARTGIAIVNPYNITQNFELRAFDQNGNQAGSRTLALGPYQHMALIAKDFFPGLSFDFVGSVKIYSTDAYFSALAIGFTPNLSFDVGYSVASIAYDDLAVSYSGTFTLAGSAGSGTITATNFEHSDSSMFTGNLALQNQATGQTFSGPFLGNVDDWGYVYAFYFELTGSTNRGLAIAELAADGSFEGVIIDDGGGHSGTFVMSPTSSTHTLSSGPTFESLPPQQDQSRPPRTRLPRSVTPHARGEQ